MMQGLKALPPNVFEELVTGHVKWHQEVGKKKSNPGEEEGN